MDKLGRAAVFLSYRDFQPVINYHFWCPEESDERRIGSSAGSPLPVGSVLHPSGVEQVRPEQRIKVGDGSSFLRQKSLGIFLPFLPNYKTTAYEIFLIRLLDRGDMHPRLKNECSYYFITFVGVPFMRFYANSIVAKLD